MNAQSSERGEVSAEMATVFSAILLLVFLVVSATSHAMASHVAAVSAVLGARAGAVADSEGEAFMLAADRVETVVSELGSEMARAPVVTFTGDEVRVEVALRAAAPFGLLPGTVSREAVVPREQYRAEHQR
jgi:hypothetical protein